MARAQWTEHHSDAASKTLDSLIKLLAAQIPVHDIYFLKARLAEEDGKVKAALDNLELAAKELNRAHISKNPFLWNQGWLYYKNSQMAEAVEIFKKIERTETSEQGRRSQALFWKGKALAKLQMNKEAQKQFEKVIDEDPVGYYGFLSFNEMQKNIPAYKPEDWPHPRPPDGFDLTLFHWLTAVGEFGLAQDMLSQQAPLKDSDSDHWPRLLPLYYEARSYSTAFYKIARLPTKDRSELTSRFYPLIFPMGFTDLIQKASDETGLWAEYLMSIIRQESSFNPLAQSGADAIGLMQLLPDIAKRLSKTSGVQYKSKEDLFDPAVNITLGARHLRHYWDNFDGNFILTTASYNASPASVKSWVKSRYNPDGEIFIEDIPYEETRNYVKLVLRNFINYQRLTTSEDAIPFPQWCLAMP